MTTENFDEPNNPGNLEYPDTIDTRRLQEYYQPPVAPVERYIDVRPDTVTGHAESAYRCLKEYEIRGFGKGLPAAEAIINIIFERKFEDNTPRSFPRDYWNRVVAVTVTAELSNGMTKDCFHQSKPQRIEDIDPGLEKRTNHERQNDIYRFREQIKRGENLGKPLYISGKLLKDLGAPADEKAIYQMDGARRIIAAVLAHRRTIDIQLLISEEEFCNLQEPRNIENLSGKIRAIDWFKNYQTIPLLGIRGQRSTRRFGMMDMQRLLDSVVYDFGSNIGQSAIKAIMAGAAKAVGFEVMDDTLGIARQMKRLSGYTNLEYFKVDFNDPHFDWKIDDAYPDKCDYSFFFSVYRTKELTQRDRLFRYIIDKTKKGIYFEGHAHKIIDTVEYYDWLFETFGLTYKFLGYSENDIRPLFYIPL
jgi:hypothetical protein